MDLMQFMRENAHAREIILGQNLAETARKYGLSLSDARMMKMMMTHLIHSGI